MDHPLLSTDCLLAVALISDVCNRYTDRLDKILKINICNDHHAAVKLCQV
jgi:hypothetical protein